MSPSDVLTREQALDPTRSFIVEAPAGSGKTELLTRRYLRLLACVREPEEVLAITFTRKAAGEMRARVLRALSLASRDTPPDNAVAATIWSLARAVRAADERCGWDLMSHPARLRIMTIDALNASLAKQLPILSGAGAALAIAPDAQALYSEVALRLVERLSGRNEHAAAIARLLRHLDNQYESFDLLLSRELARREYWLDIGLMRFELAELRAGLEATLEQIVTSELELTRDLVPSDARAELVALAVHAAAMLNSGGIASEITRCDSLTDIPPAKSDSLPQWRGLAELLLTDKGTIRARVDKNLGFPPEDPSTKDRIKRLLQRMHTETELALALQAARDLPSPKYSDAQWQVLKDLLGVLRLAVAELELVMRERGEADYVANAIAARRALGTATEPTDLALRLDYRFRHLLVDEFQDTSRGQVELLALLTAGWTDGDGRTLFCVGDPMQSIYRFRHAEVGLFLNLKRHGLNQLKLTPLRLKVNFRATKTLLDWINKAFARILPALDDSDRGSVTFTSSEPKPLADGGGGVFVHAILGDKETVRTLEAKRVADLIAARHAADTSLRIAVLVSNRQHLHWIVPELRSRGIDFQAVEIDPLAHRPAVQDLIALTRALVHLGDRTAWLATLRAPWCGLLLNDLYGLCRGGEAKTETVWQALGDATRVASLTPDGQQRIGRVTSILERGLALRGRIGLRDCVERTWLALGGPATIGNGGALRDAEAYFERLEQIERNGDIEDIARLEEVLRDLYAAPSNSVQTNVELMTIHRAKGLEFDVVILPALDCGARGEDHPILRAQELPWLGEHALLLAPIAARGADADAIYQWLSRLDKERARFEKGRLLYVAATRAERELHLFGALQSGSKPRANTFLHLLWPAVEADFAAQTEESSTQPNSAVAPAGIQTRRLPLDWRPPPPKAAARSGRFDVVEDEPLHPEFEWAGETSRHVGTLAHREIERIARAGLDTFAPTSLGSLGTRFSIELAELGVPPHLRDNAVSRVIDVLTNIVHDERGRWLLDPRHCDAASELALSAIDGGELINGVIDRTFVDASGTRWIVDFKTSAHEGGGLEEFLSRETERYRPQLQRYARLMRGFRPQEPIKAALYFPLLKAWREVPL